MDKTSNHPRAKLIAILRSKTFFNCLIFLILIVASLLRLKIINTQHVSSIESFTLLEVIKKPTLLGMINSDDSIPPLQYLVVRFISWFSTKLFWLRLPNLLFFTVTFFVLISLTKKQGKVLALITIILLSFSPYQLEHSWESYVYTLFQFWSAINLYAFYKLVREKLKKDKFILWSIVFILTNICGFFTHYSYIWFILGEFAYLSFLFVQEKIFLKKINVKYIKPFILVLITALILSLYLPTFLSIYNTALVNISWFDKLDIFDIGYNFLAIFGVYNLWHYQIVDRPYTDAVGLAVLLLFLIINVLRLKKIKSSNLINDFGFFLTLSSTLLVFLVSKIIEQSLLEKRTLVALSLIATIYLAQIINFGLRQKLSIKILTFCFTILLFFHYFREDRMFLKNQFYPEQRTNWDLAELAKKENISAIVFLKSFSCTYPQDRESMIHLEFDYYWYGHDGSSKKSPYVLIREGNFKKFFKQKDYWIVALNCDSYEDKQIENQCLHVGKKYNIDSIGFLVECKNEDVSDNSEHASSTL